MNPFQLKFLLFYPILLKAEKLIFVEVVITGKATPRHINLKISDIQIWNKVTLHKGMRNFLIHISFQYITVNFFFSWFISKIL